MTHTPDDETAVRALYQRILGTWNARDAAGMAACFSDDADMIGFDGSFMTGSAQILNEVSGIFANHTPPAYVGIVQSVRFPADDTAVVRAIGGLVPPGGDDILADLSAVQLLVAVRTSSGWLGTSYQNTPAAFHGRPELLAALNDELRKAFREHGTATVPNDS